MTRIAYIRSDNIYGDSRATKEINALLECGYTIDVFGWDENLNTLEICEKIFHGKDVKFTFYKGAKSQGSIIQKIKSFIGWMQFAAVELKKENYDFLHACDLDCGMIAKQSRIPYVYDIYDYFVDSHSLNQIFRFIFEHMEIGVINSSSATVICTEERRAQIVKAHPKKTVVIYNSPDISPTEEQNVSIKYDYAYCGTLGEGRLIKEILSAYEGHEDLHFAFAGNGTYAQMVDELSKVEPNFIFKGTIPYREVLEIERSSMVISAIYNPITRNNRLCAPNKFYEALALGKPVIVCRGTGIDKVVEQNGLGIVIDYNADEFYKAMMHLRNNPELCDRMGKAGKKLYESDFMWSKSKALLQELYSNLISLNC